MIGDGSRRDFLLQAGTVAGAALLSGCSGDVAPVASTANAAPAAASGSSAGADPVHTGSGAGAATTPTASGAPASSVTPVPSGTPAASSEPGTGSSPSAAASAQPTTVAITATSSTPVTALQAFLSSRAMSASALPPPPSFAPQILWTGALSGGDQVPTALPNGYIIPVTNSLIARPLRDRYTADLPGSPTADGYPCMAVLRPFTCKGVAKTIGSPTILRFKTDAPTVEISGTVTDNAQTVQTLIVDGALVAPKVLSSGRGYGGWDAGTFQIAFGSRQVRDVWVETAMAVAYIKIDQHDTIFAADGDAEPQITVVGDSYQLVNSPAFGNSGAMALEIGARLGIRNVAVDTIGGTGYFNTGRNDGNFNDRLPAHGADGSDIYVILGGLNDYGDALPDGTIAWPSRAVYENAVSGYLAGLRAMNPNALIVVTAPFCPDPPMSDSTYVAWSGTNSSGLGDFLYKAQVHKSAVQQIAAPWIYIDVLMGTGWLNSSGATGDATDLQWFTGGTPGAGTTATYKPGNTTGGGGGGFGGIQSIPVVTGGNYSQAPDITVVGGTGTGLLLASRIDAGGTLTTIDVLCPGSGYFSGAGLPQILIDPTYELSPASLGAPVLIVGVNPDGEYPLPSFAPPGSAGELNNVYAYISTDLTHPSPLGVSYLSRRLAADIYAAVLAL
jgi:hypothetical protein